MPPTYQISIIKKSITFKTLPKKKEVFTCNSANQFSTYIKQYGLTKRSLSSLLHSLYDVSGIHLAIPLIWAKLALRETLTNQNNHFSQNRLWDEKIPSEALFLAEESVKAYFEIQENRRKTEIGQILWEPNAEHFIITHDAGEHAYGFKISLISHLRNKQGFFAKAQNLYMYG